MQSLFRGVRRGATLATLVVMFAVSAAYADEPPPADPQNRIGPPIGLTSQSRPNPPGGVASTDGRIKSPAGRTKSQGRISSPAGVTSPEPGWFELFAEWLRAQARIHPPVD